MDSLADLHGAADTPDPPSESHSKYINYTRNVEYCYKNEYRIMTQSNNIRNTNRVT